jgi:hypothetical protein
VIFDRVPRIQNGGRIVFSLTNGVGDTGYSCAKGRDWALILDHMHPSTQHELKT